MATNIYILSLEGGNYYVGKSDNPAQRFIQHINGEGAAWTKKHRPLKLLNIYENQSPFDEDKHVKELMAKYGIDKVRGGTYVQDNQHQVANPHGRDQAPKQLGVDRHHLRARLYVVDGHGAHHQRHHCVGRNAQSQQGDERGLRTGVIGRLGGCHTTDVALAKGYFTRLQLGFLLNRVRRESCEQRAATW